jgi:hypothetical protein
LIPHGDFSFMDHRLAVMSTNPMACRIFVPFGYSFQFGISPAILYRMKAVPAAAPGG